MKPQNALSPKAPKIDMGDDLLRTLALLRERSTLSVTHVSEALSLSHSELAQVLATLQFHGFIAMAPDRKSFEPGPVLREVGRAVATLMPYRDQLRPILEGLSQRLGETVHLMILSGRSTYFLDSVEGRRLVRVAARRGASLDAHVSAGGKALLALMAPDEVAKLYKGVRLHKSTGASLTSMQALLTDLEDTRRRGYAVNAGESEDEVAAVAMTMPLSPQWPPVALSVSIPASRFNDKYVAVIVAELTTAVAEFRRAKALDA